MKSTRCLALAALLAPCVAGAQVYRVAELTTEDLVALPADRTVVLLPIAPLEEHGPYLPSFTDGFMADWLVERLADTLSAAGRPVLVFPMLPLGDGGANEIGGRFTFPGTFGVRAATLRAVLMDLVDEIAGHGFRWVFIVHSHGSPRFSRALDEAGDYFSDVHGGVMVNLHGVLWDGPPPPEPAADAAVENPLDVHAGVSESSRMLFLRPDLVEEGIRSASPVPGETMAELAARAGEADWPGYFGQPRHATPQFGAAVMRHRAVVAASVALSVLGGLDHRTLTRYADVAFSEAGGVVRAGDLDDAERARRQRDWLLNRRPRD